MIIATNQITIASLNDGVGIATTIVEYALSSSGTTPPGHILEDESHNQIVSNQGDPLTDGDWLTTVPNIPQGYYLWTRTRFVLSDGSFDMVYAVSYYSEDGQDGSSVSNVVPEYRLSNSRSSLTGSGAGYTWSEVKPECGENQYIWSRQKTTLSGPNGTTTVYSNAVCDIVLSDVVFDVNKANKSITEKVWQSDIESQINEYDGSTAQSIRDRVAQTETDINGINTTVSNVQSTLDTKADGSTVSTLSSQVSTLQQDVTGFKTTVSDTYATKADMNHFNVFIVGTQTAVTGAWTGTTNEISSLEDGQAITYWLPYNGSGNATLNLTLKDGTTTGAIPCYYSGTSRLATHYAAGNIIRLTYRTNVTIGTTTISTGWWADANYNTNNYDRTKYNGVVKAAVDIPRYSIAVGTSTGFKPLNSGAAFNIEYPILYLQDGEIKQNESKANGYTVYPATITTTQALDLTPGLPLYIKGTLSGRTFTPISTAPITQTVPNSEDGKHYMFLGTAYGTATTVRTFYLLQDHPIYMYKGKGPLGGEDIGFVKIETAAMTIAEQTAEGFSWIVKSGSSQSSLTLTDSAMTAIAKDINLNGKVTFNSFNSELQTRIGNTESTLSNVVNNSTNQVVTYARNNSSTVAPTGTWYSNPDQTGSDPYLWQKTETKNINNVTTATQIVCITGQKGEGISSTNIEYGVSSSATEEPGKQLTDGGYILKDKDGAILTNGAWQSSVPSVPPGFFLWTKTHTVYTNGTETVSYSVSKSAVSIVSTVPYYCLSTTRPTTTPLNDVVNWSASPQNYQIGKLYWKCEVITYDDHTQSVTQIVEDKGLNSANERAYLAYNSSVNVDKIMNAWTSDAITSTTTINGGYIKTHTINSEHLATNAIMSQNFLSYNNNTKPFSQTGSYLDLENGNFFSPTFAIINSVPSGSGMTAGAYFKGHVTATSLSLGGDVTVTSTATVGNATQGNTGMSVTNAGLLTAYNAVIEGNITAKTGAIGGWNITTDKLWYGNQTHGAATEAFILTPKGETVNAAIGGASGSKKWAMSIGKSFGVTINGYMYANSGKIGGWTISGSALYNGTSAMTGTGSTTAGIYIGTDGIRNYNSATSYVSISGGKITAKGADISGVITATSGSFTGDIAVGSLHIDGSSSSPKIYYNITQMSEKGTKAGFYLGSDGVAIGKGFWADASGNTSIKSGTTIGNTTIGGTTVVNNINIGSNVTGTGNNQKTQTSLQYGKDSLASTAAGFYLGTDGISIGENNIFKIDANGTTGEIGKIGPWKITSTAIYKGSSTMGAANTSTQNNAYFGDNGLSISNKFKVDSGGNATVQGVISANTFNIYTTENNVDSSLTSLIKAEYIADTNNAKVRIGQNGTYGTYITMCYANKVWNQGQTLYDDYGKMKLSAKNGIYIVNDTSVTIDGNLSLIGSPESGSEKWTITAPIVSVSDSIEVGVLDTTGFDGRLIIKGNLSNDRGEIEAGDFYARFNYRIFYEKDSTHLNETVQCVQSINPSSLGTVSGTYNNWLRFGSIASSSYPWIAMPINVANGDVYVKTGGTLYNLTTKLSSSGGTSVSPSDTTPKAVASSSSKGAETAYARGDHQHSISVGTGDSNGQVKIAGQNASVKGLGSAAYKNTTDFLSSNTSFLSGATNTSATTSGIDISLGSDTSRQYLIGIGHSSDIEITGLFYVKYSNGWKYYRIHKGSKLNNPTISGNTITLKTTEGTGVGFYCKIK